MEIKTKGIILQTVKYGDKSLIVKIYTQQMGLQSFMIKNVISSQNKKSKLAIYQPLNLVQIDYKYKESSSIQFIKEINLSYSYKSLPFEIAKSSIGLFICELLNNCLRIEQQEKNLFDYVYHSLEFLDNYEGKISNFHLHFAMQLTHFLGFFPKDDYSELNPFFDMVDGTYMSMPPIHSFSLEPESSILFNAITRNNVVEACEYSLTNVQRRDLLNKIVEYYSIHIPSFYKIQSVDVLQEVFS